VRQLVEEHGASLDEEVVGETALHFACFYGHLPVASFLLSRPACRLNKRNLGGTTTLPRLSFLLHYFVPSCRLTPPCSFTRR
jgi:ankyrin repeat protein